MNAVYKFAERPIASALADSEEFRSITDVQRQNFHSRLKYIEEICIKTQNWTDSREGFRSTVNLIDEMELDLFTNLSIGEVDRSVSPWLVHSSWTFKASPQAMADSLPSCVVDGCVVAQIGFDCGELEFLDWLKERIACLRTVLNSFYGADSFDRAVGCLIAIDISLSVLLSGVSMQRLNSRLNGWQGGQVPS